MEVGTGDPEILKEMIYQCTSGNSPLQDTRTIFETRTIILVKTRNICCVFRPAFGCCAHPKAGEILFFSRFQQKFMLILAVKSLKKLWNDQKGLTTAEKNASTSFCLRTAPKSWSKYTTNIFLFLIFYRPLLQGWNWNQSYIKRTFC